VDLIRGPIPVYSRRTMAPDRPVDLLAWGAALLAACWLLSRAWPVGGPWYTATMTRQTRPRRRRIVPVMIQPRGEFPEHTDHPRPVKSAEEARDYARQRLEDWRATHGQRD